MANTLNSKVETAAPQTFSLISNEKLLAIYAEMLECRLLEQTATELFQHGKIDSDLHGSAGREAAAAAVALDLESKDAIALAAGDWLPGFVKGLSPETLFRILAPTASQQDGSAAIEAEHKNILLPSGVEEEIEAAVKRASSALAAKDGAIVVVFIAPGPDAVKLWQKAISAAGSKDLPMIFLRYVDGTVSTGTPSSSRSNRSDALYHGVPSITVDAFDPVAIYRVAFEAFVRARQCRGATLIECTLHSPSGVGAPAAEGGTVAAMENYLKSKGIEAETHNREIVAAFRRDIALATRFLER